MGEETFDTGVKNPKTEPIGVTIDRGEIVNV